MNIDQRETAIGDMRSTGHELPTLVVYDRPTDYPDHIVLRRVDVLGSTLEPWKSVALFETLDEARRFIRRSYPHLQLLPRCPDDPPKIVETWL